MLSILKLSELLSKNDILISQIFSIDGLCVVLECKTKEITFYVYVQSKYEFDTSDVSCNELTVLSHDDYTEDGDELTNDKIILDGLVEQGSTEERLMQNYDKKIDLANSISSKKIVGQLEKILSRLNRPLTETNYGLTILHQNVLAITHYDGKSIMYFRINNFKNPSQEYKLFVNIDLENLYINSSRIYEDITIVKSTLRSILKENIFRNMKKVSDIHIGNQNTFNQDFYMNKYEYFYNNIEEITDSLNIIDSSKSEIQEEIDTLRNNENMNNIHNIGKLEQEYNDLLQTETERKRQLIKVESEFDNFLIILDKICFDIYVMKVIIKKRFTELENL